MRKLIAPEEAERRLHIIFSRAAFDPVLSSPLAGMAIAALIYVDAVCSADDDTTTIVWARPSTVVWMTVGTLSRSSEGDRRAWRSAAGRGSGAVEALHQEWGGTFERRYKDNSRETLRDETFRKWHEHGALRQRQGIAKNSSKPRWALFDDFADLFNPDLTDEDLEQAADKWRKKHLDPGARLRARRARKKEAADHAVVVTLPDGTKRTLEYGDSSEIIQGVIESWVMRRLVDPVVIAISEPGEKVHVADERMLRELGIAIDATNVLPDVLIADVGSSPVRFWIVEAVSTDGPVTEARRKDLLAWAAKQGIKAEQCSFLTGFLSRNHWAAKKRLKDIASETWAWFADEPYHELAWNKIVRDVGD